MAELALTAPSTYSDSSFAVDLLIEAQVLTRLDDGELAYHLSRREGIGQVTVNDVERWKSGDERVPFDVGIAVRDMAGLPILTGQEQITSQVRHAQLMTTLGKLRKVLHPHAA